MFTIWIIFGSEAKLKIDAGILETAAERHYHSSGSVHYHGLTLTVTPDRKMTTTIDNGEVKPARLQLIVLALDGIGNKMGEEMVLFFMAFPSMLFNVIMRYRL